MWRDRRRKPARPFDKLRVPSLSRDRRFSLGILLRKAYGGQVASRFDKLKAPSVSRGKLASYDWRRSTKGQCPPSLVGERDMISHQRRADLVVVVRHRVALIGESLVIAGFHLGQLSLVLDNVKRAALAGSEFL